MFFEGKYTGFGFLMNGNVDFLSGNIPELLVEKINDRFAAPVEREEMMVSINIGNQLHAIRLRVFHQVATVLYVLGRSEVTGKTAKY